MGHLRIYSPKSNNGTLSFEIIENDEDLNMIAEIFERNTDRDYIAMGDVESDRINENLTWDENIKYIFKEEYKNDKENVDYIAIRNECNEIVGLVIVCVNPRTKYAILYDIIIDRDERGKNYGTTTYEWLEDQLRKMGTKRILLESGINNKNAHSFFRKMGFSEFAIEFIKGI